MSELVTTLGMGYRGRRGTKRGLEGGQSGVGGKRRRIRRGGGCAGRDAQGRKGGGDWDGGKRGGRGRRVSKAGLEDESLGLA